jgi:glycolate oxidase
MKKYNVVTLKILAELKKILGEKNLTVDKAKLENYSHDEVTDANFHYMPEVVVFPETTQQVADIVKLANRELIPIVPRGAGTGVACGATPVYGGIVLTTEKMNKIIKVDTDSMYIIAEAGVLTEDVQNAAKKVGLYYPGDPCSGDSCFIGGNVATNAGGNKAVKYGTTRHQVYAMEVVTPLGEITNLGARLSKLSTGYALEQLLIGSEGTLGIMTQVTLKLKPLPEHVIDLLAVFPTVETAISSVLKLIKRGVAPTCLEFMDNRAICSVEKFLNEKLPHGEDANYLIIQVERDSQDQLDDVAVQVDEMCTENGAIEVLVSDPQKIWRARKAYAEAIRAEDLTNVHEDMVVPLEALPVAMAKMVEIVEKYHAVARTASHAGDGNIHLSILKGAIPDDQWLDKLTEMHHDIFDIVYPLGGRLSGEHGIGFKKKLLMEKYTDPVELQMMRTIKKALDPNLILNPGKIFDVD